MRTHQPLRLRLAATAVGLLMASGAVAAEAIKRIDIFVQPYYASADGADGPPTVAVGDTYSVLLASTDKNDVVTARDKVIAGPQLVTPMTMMVLAIRLYDFGLRDDAAFWFYTAKDRFITLARVVDIDAAGLGGVRDAIKSFAAPSATVQYGSVRCTSTRRGSYRRACHFPFMRSIPPSTRSVMRCSLILSRPTAFVPFPRHRSRKPCQGRMNSGIPSSRMERRSWFR
jgi:hypothetical protein